MPLKLVRHKYPGYYVLIEGADGTGKSELAKRLEVLLGNYYSPLDRTVLRTAEPMQVRYGNVIRERFNEIEQETSANRYELAYAFGADRQYHQEVHIRPWLEAGMVIIQDRGSISTMVYQDDLFGGHPEILCYEIIKPDLLILLECSETDFMKRRDGGKNLYERMPYATIKNKFVARTFETFDPGEVLVYNTSIHTDPTLLVQSVADTIQSRADSRWSRNSWYKKNPV